MAKRHMGQLGALGLLVGILHGGPVGAETVLLEATLRGSQEVPAVATGAKGTGTILLDTLTNTVRFTVSHSVLNATAAHFHGPAFPGTNGGIVVDIGAQVGVGSPMIGQAVLTGEQQAELLAGLWYLNVHSGAHGGGEIRGQLSVVTPDPITMFPRSGPMAQTSGGDLTILVKTDHPSVTITGGAVTLNGDDVTPGFAACVRLGTLLAGGVTLRCPVPGGLLTVGENFISVVVELSDQRRLGTAVVYDVEAVSEP